MSDACLAADPLRRLAAAVVGVAAVWALLVLALSPAARRAVRAGPGREGAPPGAERVRVARAVDGDTLALTDGRTIRVLGIDAPETHHPALAGAQPFGEEAAAHLALLVDGRTVALELDNTPVDHYGRLLRHVWVGRTLVAEDLLQAGLAHAMSIPPDTAHRERLRAAESAARRARRGLWALPRPTALAVFGTPAP